MARSKLLPNLHKRTLLLLLGGVFSIGAIALFFQQYRFVLEPRWENFEGTVAEMTFYGSSSEREGALKAAGISATGSAETTFLSAQSPATVYATIDSATSVPSLHIAGGKTTKRIRLISRRVSGIGFIRLPNKQPEPLELRLEKTKFEIRIGRSFRGFMPSQSAFDIPRRAITIVPNTTQTYLYAASPIKTSFILNAFLDTQKDNLNSKFYTFFQQLSGSTELLLANSQQASSPNFILYTEKLPLSLQGEDFDNTLKNWLGELEPRLVTIRLADGSSFIEKRSSAQEVELKQRITAAGIIKTFSTPQGKTSLVVLQDSNQHVWISNNLEILEGIILQTRSTGDKGPICGSDHPNIESSIYPQSFGVIGHIGDIIHNKTSIKTLIFALNIPNSELVTLCGYF